MEHSSEKSVIVELFAAKVMSFDSGIRGLHLEEVLKIRFTDTKVKPMPDQIEQWVKEDNDERRTEKQNGMRPGEWMQDELNDIAVAQAMRNKEDTRTYEEIKEGIKEESKASGGIIDPKV